MKTIRFLTILFAAQLIYTIAHAQTLRVMTYNIHHGADKDENDKLKEIGMFIKNSGADLVGLQEVDSVCTRSGKVDQMKTLAALTGMHYAFVRHFAYQGGAYGQGILSKYPLSDVKNNRLTLLKKDSLRASLAMISAQINISRKQQVVFASAHYSLDEPTRMLQAQETISFAAQQKLPVIFTGDLNATPEAAEIRYLDTLFNLTNDKGNFTFPADKPVRTIDYIYVTTPHLERVIADIAPKVEHSDHLPVMTTSKLKQTSR